MRRGWIEFSDLKSAPTATLRCQFVARFLVPFILCLSGSGKLLSWDSYVRAGAKLLFAVDTPIAAHLVILVTLPFVEIVAALLILVGWGAAFRIGAWATFALTVLFVAMRLRLAIEGIEFICPCFGDLIPTDQVGIVGAASAAFACCGAAVLVVFGDPWPNPKNTLSRTSMGGPSAACRADSTVARRMP